MHWKKSLALLASLASGLAVAEEALRIPEDAGRVSTFSATADPNLEKRLDVADPAAKARSAYYFMNYTVARRLWEPLAEGGHADAQFGLFQIHSLGQHVTPDLDLAMHWLRPAARQRHPAAMFHQGLAYLRGEGEARDTVAAWLWFRRAELKEYAGAARARASVERRLSADELVRARALLEQP